MSRSRLVLPALLVLAWGVSSSIALVWATNRATLALERARFEVRYFSLDPGAYPGSSFDTAEQRSRLDEIARRLAIDDADRATLRSLRSTPEGSWLQSERDWIAEFVEARRDTLEESLVRFDAPDPATANGPRGESNELPNYMAFLSIARVLELRSISNLTSTRHQELVADFERLLEFAVRLYAEPRDIADLVAAAVERDALRLANRELLRLSPTEAETMARRLESLDEGFDPRREFAPELAVLTGSGMDRTGLPWLGLTSDGARSLYLSCVRRIFDIFEHPFDVAAAEIDAIEDSPPISRNAICRRFARSRYEHLVKLETQRSLRRIAILGLRSRASEGRVSVGEAREAACESSPPLPPGPLGLVVTCRGLSGKCQEIRGEVDSGAWRTAFARDDTRALAERLLVWSTCRGPESADI